MLCFLPPVVPPPRESRGSPAVPADPSTVVGAVIVIVGSLALLFPIGCVRPMTVYTARVGERVGLGPRPVDRDLIDELRRTEGGAGPSSRRPTFFASRAAYGAGDAPPGTMVDAATGALVGTPSMAGSYTMAVGLADGKAASVTGPAFMVKILPASVGALAAARDAVSAETFGAR